MSKRITLKLIVIGFLGLLLWIPLLLEQGVIYERMSYRSQVVSDIASKWTGQQTITGPIVVIPWQLQYQENQWSEKEKIYKRVNRKLSGKYLLLPSQLTSHADIKNDTRSRGIYQIPVYSGRVNIDGVFSNQKLLKYKTQLENKHKGQLSWGQARVTVLMSDMRGIVSEPDATWGKHKLTFVAGSSIKSNIQGISAELPTEEIHTIQALNLTSNKPFSTTLSLSMPIKGMETLLLTPAGDNSNISMKSDWPHPSFTGRHLPTDYEITDTGFSANWSTSPFSGDLNAVLKTCQDNNYCDLNSYAVGTEFIDPVDMYSQAERAIKYGLLFIAVTFMLFFLFEVLKKLQIHPIQYGMVGMALALFYLLLVSLSEHIAFIWAYTIATIACCGLLGIYLSAVLKSPQRGGWFAGGITALYGLLYMIISSEDFALLMGSVLIFSTLAIGMLTTRKVDWYQISQTGDKTQTKVEVGKKVSKDLDGK